MAETDENLMLAVRDGDVEKLGLPFDRPRSSLFDFFSENAASRSAAEDVEQDVFFRMSHQESHMVQIALIDLAVDLRDKESVHTLEQFTDQTSGRTRTRA